MVLRKGIKNMNMIRKLKNRKGFTMVELIIVIAIIGVLLAMILPNLLSSNKDTQGKGFAKEFFYKTQDFVSRQKLVEDPSAPTFNCFPAGTFPNIILYAKADSNGTVSETGVILYDTNGNYSSGDETPRSLIDSSSSYTTQFRSFMSKFEGDVEKYVTSTGYDCTYYAVVDREFRVQAAYWTDCSWNDIVSGNSTLSFTDDCIVGDYYSCAYPTSACMAGRKMFTY